MRNALQEQLLKAGLAKKSKVDQIAREQIKQRQGKAPPPHKDEQADAERLRQERVERDRALAAERNAQVRAQELRAQARQIVEQNKLPTEGEVEYRFTDGNAIRSLLVTEAVRGQLAKGSLAIARHDQRYAIIPQAAADKVEARDATMIVVNHARSAAPSSDADDDEYYSQFKVPDDLVW
jgi:uncharacterized protein YaiL (DUF2058 family)